MAGLTHRWTGHLGLRAPDRPLFRHLARSTGPIDQIDFLAEQGFAGVQDNYVALRDPAEQERIAGHVRRLGLAMGSFVHDPSGWNLPRWSAADDAGRAALATELDHSLATARRIGGRTVICVAGLDPARSHEAQRDAMAANLRAAGDRAAAAGVTLCVEGTAPWLTDMLVGTIDDAAAIVRAADHPAVRLMFDIGHIALAGGDPLEALSRYVGLIGAVQAADVPGRVEAGAGSLDWPALLAALDAAGHDGLIEIECEPADDSADGEQRLLERLRAIDGA